MSMGLLRRCSITKGLNIAAGSIEIYDSTFTNIVVGKDYPLLTFTSGQQARISNHAMNVLAAFQMVCTARALCCLWQTLLVLDVASDCEATFFWNQCR